MKSPNRNRWENPDTGATVTSEAWPGDGFFPLVAISRVRRSNYTPYEQGDGSKQWVEEANRVLASMARAHFEKYGR